ncbi:MAG: DUF4384 domain-containing protein [Epsilonproteobacteria bacterium]|nr:DUF4384 domain-containing protein [Campylobacterota bacterium]
MHHTKKILLLLILCIKLLSADVLEGVGYAQNMQEAKKEALADISQVIKSEVRSNFESFANNNISHASSHIKISSNLPILGAEFNYIDRVLEVEAHVKLTPKKVKKLYVKKIESLYKQLDTLKQELQKTDKSSLKLKLYEEIFSLLGEYERYASVAMILGADTKEPPLNKADVKIALAKLTTDINSLEIASRVLEQSFKNYKNIYLYPPMLQNTTTASEFSSVFLQKLKPKLHLSLSLKKASYIMTGEYILTDKTIVLNYQLLSVKNHSIKKSKTITINKKAYKNLKTKPKNIDFDALLNSGIIISDNLKVSLKSNKGSEGLLFRSGEDVELFIKLNKMGYVYIVGYTQTGNGKFSYLLELNEGDGDSRFVKFINADDANHWISLGKFSVEKPFGVESLQTIASNKKISSLPNAIYDTNSGYYIISKNIKKALVKTRGLKKKKSHKAEFSEAVLSFTTVK